MFWKRGPDYWATFGVTFAFMMIWTWTPLGAWETWAVEWLAGKFVLIRSDDQATDIGVWTWPVTGLLVFFVARTFIRRFLIKRRANPTADEAVDSQSS
jgi:hypothetical protein